jgi:HEAT repeat protein
VLAAAELASGLKPGVTAQLAKAMQDPHNGVRYWGAMGVLMRGADEVRTQYAAIRKALDDASPSVRIVAAEALGRYGSAEDLALVMPILLKLANPVDSGAYVAMQSLNAISNLGKKASPWKDQIATLPKADPNATARVRSEYTTRLITQLAAGL